MVFKNKNKNTNNQTKNKTLQESKYLLIPIFYGGKEI